MKAYYHALAREYDDWWLGEGRYEPRRRPGWDKARDALDLPFPDGSFDRVFASYFYCHLEEPERLRSLAEARRVAPELLIVGTVHREGLPASRWEERILNDGSRWEVYKRYFEPEPLVEELGGGRVLFEYRDFFLMVASP